MAPRFRRFLRWLHLVVGLTAGLVLVPLGLSGSILVFREELDAALNPELRRVAVAEGPPASVDRILDAVEIRYPDARVSRVDFPAVEGETVEVVLAGGRSVFADPGSGRVLGTRTVTDHLTGWLFDLHHHLLLGEPGETATGVVGIALVVLVVSGVMLWWRGMKQSRLRVRWSRTGSVVAYDLHNVVGVTAALVLTLSAATGCALIFDDVFDASAQALTGSAAPVPAPKSVPIDGQRRAPLAPMLQTAQVALPGARLARLNLPNQDDGAVVVRLRAPGEIHPVGMSRVFFDAYSGAVLRVAPAPQAAAAERAGHWRYPLHTGAAGGWPLRVLLFVAGLSPLVLLVTGVLYWWPTSRMGRARKRAKMERQTRS